MFGGRITKKGVFVDGVLIPFKSLRWNFGLIECYLRKGNCDYCTNGKMLDKLETAKSCLIKRYLRAMAIANKKPDEFDLARVQLKLNEEFYNG